MDQKGFTHTNPSVIHGIIHPNFTRENRMKILRGEDS